MKITATRLFPVVLLFLILGLAQNAQALNITPANAFASGNEGPGNNDVLDAAEDACGCTLDERFKQDVGGGESGPFASSYSATFTPSGDPDAFQITYTGGPAIGPTAWLIVKDGNNTPIWYLFNLTDLGWTGTQTINGTEFWPGSGAVSHVEIRGSDDEQEVPEPTSLLLLGSGILALGLVGRKLKQ